MLRGYYKSGILCIVVYAIILITCGNTNHTLKAHNVKDGKTTERKKRTRLQWMKSNAGITTSRT